MKFQDNTCYVSKVQKQMSYSNQCGTWVDLMGVTDWQYPQLTRKAGRRILSLDLSLDREIEQQNIYTFGGNIK